jgi:hypothetical protein
MAGSPYFIVWDLDRTLGVFDGLERLRDPAAPMQVELRPGIGAALAELSAAGFVHTVLTMATPDYAELALRGAGLRGHFVEVACQGQRPKGDVEGIARTHGLPEAELPARMLFVGDHVLFDAPQDARVLFHLEPHVLHQPASRLVALVLALRERGGGSLRAGFDHLLGPAEAFDEIVRRELVPVGRLVLLPREHASPVVAFDEEAPTGAPAGERVTFVPAEAYPELAVRLR